jgi:hypothetical protein
MYESRRLVVASDQEWWLACFEQENITGVVRVRPQDLYLYVTTGSEKLSSEPLMAFHHIGLDDRRSNKGNGSAQKQHT